MVQCATKIRAIDRLRKVLEGADEFQGDGDHHRTLEDFEVDPYDNASWNRGIWSDGHSATLYFTNNTISNVRSAMNLDYFDGTRTTVSGNRFIQDGSGISIGLNAANLLTTGISNNTFDGVDFDFNFQNQLHQNVS